MKRGPPPIPPRTPASDLPQRRNTRQQCDRVRPSGASRKGPHIASSAPISCCRDGIVADRERLFRMAVPGWKRTGRKFLRQLRRGGPDCGLALPAGAMEGRPSANPGRCGKSAAGRAFADRARWQCRGQVVRPGGRTALLLVRRGRVTGRRDLARDADTQWRARRLRHNYARHHGERRQTAGPGGKARKSLAHTGVLEPGDGESLFGMDRKAVRWAARPGAVVEDVGRGAARPFPQHAVQLSGSRRRQSAESHAPRLRGFRLFLARLFRIQDGPAVRLFELLARQRRRAAEVLPVVRHRASRSHAPGAAARTSHRTNRRRPGAGAGAQCAAEVVRAAGPACLRPRQRPSRRSHLRRSSWGLRRRSPDICRRSPTSSKPERCAYRRPTTAPIFTWCR